MNLLTQNKCLWKFLWILPFAPFQSFAQQPGTGTSIDDAYTNCINKDTADPTAIVIDGSDSKCAHVTISSASPPTKIGKDVTNPLPRIIIKQNGILDFGDTGDLKFYATSFNVQDGGLLQIGTEAAPITKSHITIVMTGKESKSRAPDTMNRTPMETRTEATNNARDITIEGTGQLFMYGSKGRSDSDVQPQNTVYGTNSWTYLAKPAGPISFNSAANVFAPVPDGGDTVITLAKEVDWKAGDWISIATTSFSSHQTEIVQIKSVSSVPNPDTGLSGSLPTTVSQITLGQALKNYHFGGNAPSPGYDSNGTIKAFSDGKDRNFGVDERAEVALLSRNITLTSSAGETTNQITCRDGSQGCSPFPAENFGGHIAILPNSSDHSVIPTVKIVGVEIEKFGQPLVGRYPVHLHHLSMHVNFDPKNDPPANQNILVQDVSVHHSYNKCFTVHGTSGVTFSNNVCVRTIGQGFYLEDGEHIFNNSFARNLIAGTMLAAADFSTPDGTHTNHFWEGDNLAGSIKYSAKNIQDASLSGQNGNITAPIAPGRGLDSMQPNGFWITNVNNIFKNNSVAGCQGQGMGYWFVGQPKGSDAVRLPFKEFSGNRVHGCYYGIFGDGIESPGGMVSDNPKPTDTGDASGNPVLTVLSDNTVTRSRKRGLWTRAGYYALQNNKFVANLNGVTLLGGGGPEGNTPGFFGVVSDNIFIGTSQNNVERFGSCLTDHDAAYRAFECTTKNPGLPNFDVVGGFLRFNQNIQGYSFYDGPAYLIHNKFVNFRVDFSKFLTTTESNFYASNKPLFVMPAPPIQTEPAHIGYEGDPAVGWIQSNAQSVPPVQYMDQNIWVNTDFKHQVYTLTTNLGQFSDGDANTVILDKDSTLSYLKLANSQDPNHHPISLNNLEFFATDFTVNEPDSQGLSDFRASSLMSPHLYGALQIEFNTRAGTGFPAKGTYLLVRRNMLYNLTGPSDDDYPHMYLTGRNQNPVFEPLVMDHMGYVLYYPPDNSSAFPQQVAVGLSDIDMSNNNKFVTQVGFCRKVTDPAKISVKKVFKYYGQSYASEKITTNPCLNFFWSAPTLWATCDAQASSVPQSADWTSFKRNFTDLMVPGSATTENWFYDKSNQVLYVNMVQNQASEDMDSPTGTCTQTNFDNLRNKYSGSNKESFLRALTLSCRAEQGTVKPQKGTCPKEGCVTYMIDFGDKATDPTCGTSIYASSTSPDISKTDFATWEKSRLVYSVPNGTLPINNPDSVQDGESLLLKIITPNTHNYTQTPDFPLYPLSHDFPYSCASKSPAYTGDPKSIKCP